MIAQIQTKRKSAQKCCEVEGGGGKGGKGAGEFRNSRPRILTCFGETFAVPDNPSFFLAVHARRVLLVDHFSIC